MITDMLVRVLITLGLFGAGWLIYHLVSRVLLQRAASGVRDLPGYQPGYPTVVYFTTPGCMACQTQKPAIVHLQEKIASPLQVIEIDAAASPDLARAWQVLSVPTIFILDRQGVPRHINCGLTDTNKLYAQVKEILS